MKKNSNYPWPNWMGIRGFYFVWHGEWSDPEIVWHGYAMNINCVEEPMWEYYCNDCEERGIEANEDGFEDFCKEHVENMRGYAQDAIWNKQAHRIQRGVFHYKNNFFGKKPFELLTLPAY